MNWGSWLVWGFGSTVVLTILVTATQALGFTRMDLPYLLGTMFTTHRGRAKIAGAVMHLLNGLVFSLVYVAAFHVTGVSTWWFGATIGLVHGAFVLAVALPILPGIHRHMASELHGPSVARQLEPPGFLGLNYGYKTPISILASHIVFGAVLGGFYSA